MRVLHIITTLETGGAELLLVRLVQSLNDGIEHHVVVLAREGEVSERLKSMGVGVTSFHWQQISNLIGAPLSLHKVFRNFAPDLVHGWMIHANLAAILLKLMHPRIPVVWGIHNGLLDKLPVRTKGLIRLGATLSHWVNRLTYISAQSRLIHEQVGYCKKRVCQISNGVDINLFKPDADARERIRSLCGISQDCAIAGWVGRDHPQKDADTMLRAAEIACSEHPDLHVVMIGEGIDDNNQRLFSLHKTLNNKNRIHMLGRLDDVHLLMPGFDVLVSSSLSEACPTVLLEALACGIPCVATEVGDTSVILDSLGKVVPPCHPQALAQAIAEMLAISASEKIELSARSVDRVRQRYSMESFAKQHLQMYRELTLGIRAF